MARSTARPIKAARGGSRHRVQAEPGRDRLHRAPELRLLHTGAYLYAGLVQGTDGALYGTAYSRRHQRSRHRVQAGHERDRLHGAQEPRLLHHRRLPLCALVQGTDGALYGAAYQGGSSGVRHRVQAEHERDRLRRDRELRLSTTGGYPRAGLVQRADGALWHGKQLTVGAGTTFKLNTDGSDFSVLKNFDCYGVGRRFPLWRAGGGNGRQLYGATIWRRRCAASAPSSAWSSRPPTTRRWP